MVAVSVDGSLRLVSKGAGMMGFLGKTGRGCWDGWQGFGMMGNGSSSKSNADGLRMPTRGGASNIEYR